MENKVLIGKWIKLDKKGLKISDFVGKWATLESGNSNFDIEIVGGKHWETEDKERIYFDVKSDGQAYKTIDTIYIAIKGGVNKNHFSTEVGDLLIGYYGGDAGSQTKRAAQERFIKKLFA